MAKYRVTYGGRWRGTYSTQEEAERAAAFEAEHVGEVVLVIKSTPFRNQFVNAFPEEERDRARDAWKAIVSWKGASPMDYVRRIRWGR